MQKINKTLNIILCIILLFSMFFVKKIDKLFHCIAIGVSNNSISLFIAIPDNENNISIKRYIVDGNDYENVFRKAKKDGLNIDVTVLRSIFYSEDLSYENRKKFNFYAKDVFDISCLVYVCKIDILLEKDSLDNEGVFAINDLYGKNNGGTIFLDVLYGRKTPLKIIYNNNTFLREKND